MRDQLTFLRPSFKSRKLEKIDFEDETQETFGVGKIEDFRQNQLIDLYACVECGRCTNMCPATGTGKMLSPMDLILKLRDHLTDKGAAVTSKAPWPAAIGAGIILITGLVSKPDVMDIISKIGGASITILATIVMAVILESFGFFHWSAAKLANLAKGSGRRLYWYIQLLCFLMTFI